MDKEKFNPFKVPEEDLEIKTQAELEEAKKAAGVVSEHEHANRMLDSSDPKLKGVALQRKKEELFKLNVSGRRRTEVKEEKLETESKSKEQIEKEIQDELEEMTKREILLQEGIKKHKNKIESWKPLEELLHFAYERTTVQLDLEGRISNLQAQLAGLEKSIFGRIKDKTHESAINSHIAELKAHVSNLPTESEKAKGEATSLAPKFGLKRDISYQEFFKAKQDILEQIKVGEMSLKQILEKRKFLTRPQTFLAYGGTGFQGQGRIGRWSEKPEGMMQDYYGLAYPKEPSENGDVSFGVGEEIGKRFIILRQRQNVSNRGGYPYTIFLDPGEVIWRLYDWNAALVVKNILQNPLLKNKLLDEPREMHYREGKIVELAELEKAERKIIVSPDANVEKIWESALEATSPIVIGPRILDRPTPEKFAEVLAALPKAVRKDITWLIGGGGAHGRALDLRIVWDPKK